VDEKGRSMENRNHLEQLNNNTPSNPSNSSEMDRNLKNATNLKENSAMQDPQRTFETSLLFKTSNTSTSITNLPSSMTDSKKDQDTAPIDAQTLENEKEVHSHYHWIPQSDDLGTKLSLSCQFYHHVIQNNTHYNLCVGIPFMFGCDLTRFY
jgi:hypothetical protein